jgi:hypothetical protein
MNSQTGSLAANFHEARRSEYLAQYIFASFGTALLVSTQEDYGIDLQCTITERVGQRAWPVAYFTVQVKSVDKPWVFDTPESLRWLLDHPIPVFICVVSKKEARLRVYQTAGRHQPGLAAPLELVLGESGEAQTLCWESQHKCLLGAPIVDRTVDQLLDEKTFSETREIIKEWAIRDARNIDRWSWGAAVVKLPYSYVTNDPKTRGGTTTVIGREHEADDTLIELLDHLGGQRGRDAEFTTAALFAMLHRRLTKGSKAPEHSAHHTLTLQLNERTQMRRYRFDTVDHLIEQVQLAVEPDAVPIKPAEVLRALWQRASDEGVEYIVYRGYVHRFEYGLAGFFHPEMPNPQIWIYRDPLPCPEPADVPDLTTKPLADCIVLAHEYGHFRSWLEAERGTSAAWQAYFAAARARDADPRALNDEQRRLILDEEHRAWDLGATSLRALGFVEWGEYDRHREAGLRGHRIQLGLEEPATDGG